MAWPMSMITASTPPDKPRRQVAIRRDGDDFVAAFLPEDFIIFRHHDAAALRKVCRSLRWEILRDTAEEDYLRAMVMEAVQDRRV
jgi:hypothetical protein